MYCTTKNILEQFDSCDSQNIFIVIKKVIDPLDSDCLKLFYNFLLTATAGKYFVDSS